MNRINLNLYLCAFEPCVLFHCIIVVIDLQEYKFNKYGSSREDKMKTRTGNCARLLQGELDDDRLIDD